MLDTPPSRNALDFLDAPMRLLGFLEGRALQVFLAPGGLTARLFGRGTGLVFAIFARVTGVDMMGELSRFFRSLTGVIDGFGGRRAAWPSCCARRGRRLLIVTSPEPEPAREASFWPRAWPRRGWPAAGLIVNRVHIEGLHGHTVEQVEQLLQAELGERLAGRVAANLADFDVLVRRDGATVSD